MYQLRQAGLAQLVDGAEEARRQLLALFAGAVFLQQQVAELLFETVDQLQRRVSGQVGGQAKLLIGSEVVAMTAQQGEQVRGSWRRPRRVPASRPGSGD